LLDEDALVPANWPLEVAQALLSADRRGRITRERRMGAIGHLEGLPILVDRETPDRAMSEIAQIAGTHALTIHDAAYVELARRAGLPLATFYRGLARAAEKHGVSQL
jgi:predicted nucleic acid-binding protein